MSAPDQDDKPGYGRPPISGRWRKGQTGNPKKKYSPRDISALATIDRLLLSSVKLSINGHVQKISALEAIVSQLWIKEMAGDRRALRTRLRYEKLARRHGKPTTQLVFVENEYTQDLASGIGKKENVDD